VTAANPPEKVELTLEETQLLFAALEDAVDVLVRLMRHEQLQVFDLVGPIAGLEYQMGVLANRLGWTGGGSNAG
jgi:hypothetical protein